MFCICLALALLNTVSPCHARELSREVSDIVVQWNEQIRTGIENSRKFPHVENFFWKVADQWYPKFKKKKLLRFEDYTFADFIDLMITHSFHRERIPQLFRFIKDFISRRSQKDLPAKESAFYDSLELLKNKEYLSLLKEVFNTDLVECTLYSSTYLAAYFIRASQDKNPPKAELVSGLLFHPEYSPAGELHQWVKIGPCIIDPSISVTHAYKEYTENDGYVPLLGSEMDVTGKKARILPRVYCYPKDLNHFDEIVFRKNSEFKLWQESYRKSVTRQIAHPERFRKFFADAALADAAFADAALADADSTVAVTRSRSWKKLESFRDFSMEHIRFLVPDALNLSKDALMLSQQIDRIQVDPAGPVPEQAFRMTLFLMNQRWYTESLKKSGLDPETDSVWIMTCAGLCLYLQAKLKTVADLRIYTGLYFHPSGRYTPQYRKWWVEFDGILIDPVNCLEFRFRENIRPIWYLPLIGIKISFQQGSPGFEGQIYCLPENILKTLD